MQKIQYDILILYGSQTGNAQYLAEEVERELILRGFITFLCSFEDYIIQNLPEESHILFIVATTGQGDPPTNMKKFWKFLLIESLPQDSLSNIKFTIFGLGDSNYIFFNAMARKLNTRLLQLGAQSIQERGLGDDQHPQGYNFEFDIWLNNLWNNLKKDFPNINFDIQQQQSLPISKHTIKYLENQQTSQNTKNENIVQSIKLSRALQISETFFVSKVLSKEKLTAPNYDKESFKIEFENTINKNYQCGDILVIQPENNEKLINDFASILNLDLQQTIQISKNPLYKSQFKNIFPEQMQIKELLTYWLNISGQPNRYFLKLLSYFVQNDLHKEKLQEMSGKTVEAQEEYYSYIVREKRNIFEVLFDFQSFQNFPLEFLLESINILQPREYSISSSYLKDKTIVAITLGCVQYQTPFKRTITGISSNYLKNIQIQNQQILLSFKQGTLPYPNDLTTPVIMIGPGTGVAPHIGFIQQRNKIIEDQILQNQQLPENLQNNTILIFGCRNKQNDYYYEQFLEDLHQNQRITLYTAFSRDFDAKVYVQHLVIKYGKELAQLIENNFQNIRIFVCGTSKFMPQQVEEAFEQIIFEKTNDKEKAKNIIQILKKQNQYVVEAW